MHQPAEARHHNRKRRGERLAILRDEIRRAFAEFLTLPSAIIAGFVALAVGTYALDRAELGWLDPARRLLQRHFFADGKATGDLLGTIAGSLITVTSITFSLLLLAVQQAAAALTTQVFDQFLRRRLNQIAFGFFVGLALFALITLATVAPPFNPVFGGTLALLLASAALCLLLLLLYATIDQMRPAVIIEAIHDHTLAARERQHAFLQRTRRRPQHGGASRTTVHAARRGFVTRVDLEAIRAAVTAAREEVEIVLLVSIGSPVAYQDPLAEVYARLAADAAAVARTVPGAIHLERQRDLETDPAFGIEQLETIAWTSISTAKSNPAPGLLTIHSLRNLLAHWAHEAEEAPPEEPSVPVVYQDDVPARLMAAFEALAVAASESMQHQTFAAVLCTLAIMLDRLPAEQQQRAEDLVLRVLSALGDHVLTAALDAALAALVSALTRAARLKTAVAVQDAREKLRQSVGKLGSRSSRVPPAA